MAPRTAALFALVALLLAGCDDLFKPRPPAEVEAVITGPETLVGERREDGSIYCSVRLHVRATRGNTPDAYLRWGGATLGYAKIAVAETAEQKWDTEAATAFWGRPVTFAGESHHSGTWGFSWNAPFILTLDFVYFSAPNGELSPTIIKRAQHTLRCE